MLKIYSLRPLEKPLIAVCIGCGCDDFHACVDELNDACSWLVVNRNIGLGVCSSCPEHLKRWDNAENVPVQEGLAMSQSGGNRVFFRPDIHAGERVVQPVELFFDVILPGTPLRIGCKFRPVIGQGQAHLLIGQLFHSIRCPLVLSDKGEFQCLPGSTCLELLMPVVFQPQPLSEPQQPVGPLHQFCTRVSVVLLTSQMVKIFRALTNKIGINVGLILAFIHIPFSQFIVGMKLLAVPSDRSRETLRSENDLSVGGSISLPISSPAPFSEIYMNVFNAMNLHVFNVDSALLVRQEGGR